MKQFPHSYQAESQVLSALLSFPEGRDLCLSKLSESHFYDRRNGKIFKTVSEMTSKSLHIDARTVLNASDGKDTELEVYLFQLGVGFPTISSLEVDIQEIKEMYRLRKLLELSGDIQKHALTHGTQEGYFDRIEKRFLDISEERQDDNLLQGSSVKVLETLQQIEEGRGIGAIKTGVDAVDTVLQGIAPGMMDVYAAEAGAGKTSLAEMMIVKFIEEDRGVVVFERDMTPEGFLFRVACRMVDVSVSQIRRWGHRFPDQLEAVKKAVKRLSSSRLYLYSPDGCTGADVRAIARREKRRHGIELVIVDHIRTLKHNKGTSWEGIEENSGYIRQSTNETGVAHIVLAHINREGVKADRPTISNIKGGDQLKDDADNCCVMWAPEGRSERQWKVNFAFDKTRWDFSSIETMNYNGPKMKFEKIEKEPIK